MRHGVPAPRGLRSHPSNLLELVLAKGLSMTTSSVPVVPVDPADLSLRRLRETSPLVQCITNAVVTGFTANVLLAVGAVPAMVDIPTEAGAFATAAGGLLVNLGTPTAEQRQAAREATAATDRWVLDPVAVGSLPVRTP